MLLYITSTFPEEQRNFFVLACMKEQVLGMTRIFELCALFIITRNLQVENALRAFYVEKM